MSTWTNHYRIAIPTELIPLGNKAAALFDPHGGGLFTFTSANAPEDSPTHCLIRTQLVNGYQDLLAAPRDSVEWFDLLSSMAIEKELPTLTFEEVEMLCAEILFDGECEGL
jgi:hypothetical protein